MTNNSNSRKPTARELVAAKQVQAPQPAPAASGDSLRRTAVAVPDHRPYRERYLDEVAPSRHCWAAYQVRQEWQIRHQ